MIKTNEEESRQYNIKLSNTEVEQIRDITKIDPVATAVVAIVRRFIATNKTDK